jgi:hypothetical protein
MTRGTRIYGADWSGSTVSIRYYFSNLSLDGFLSPPPRKLNLHENLCVIWQFLLHANNCLYRELMQDFRDINFNETLMKIVPAQELKLNIFKLKELNYFNFLREVIFAG